MGIEEGFVTFVNQLDAPDSKAMRFKTSLPFVWIQAGGHDPGDQLNPAEGAFFLTTNWVAPVPRERLRAHSLFFGTVTEIVAKRI
jgi:hypothetical protein